MTICIAALCDGGKSVVVASDRMVSGGDVEFEQDLQKIDHLSERALAMTAGSALEHVDLLRTCCALIKQRTSPLIYEIAELIKERFVELRQKRSEEAYFKPLGLTIDYFLKHQTTLSENTVLRLNRCLETNELELEMIIAGVDHTGAHIYLISDPGIAQCFDSLGFCCIGSGQHHATMTFVRTGYHTGIPAEKVAYLVYEAKRDSEVAPGVGERFTDVAIVTGKKVIFLKDELITQFRKLYDGSRETKRKFFEQLDRDIEELKIIEED